MRWLLFFWMFIISAHSQKCKDLDTIRAIFQKGVNEQELERMIEICERSSCRQIIPYYAASLMKKAEFVWSPFEKLSTFKKGKKKLEEFIAKNPKNIEAKYIRWLTQKMAPKFLGYRDRLEEDYQYIQKNIHQSNINPSYQKVMLNHIKKIQDE